MKNTIFIILFSLFITVVLALVLFWPTGDNTPADNQPATSTEATETPEVRTVVLYYYQPEADMDAAGNIQCSPAGLVGIFRDIPQTQSPLTDTLELLLRGELTTQERQMGITTEFPLEGVELVGVNLADGVATIALSDPNFQTSGGACRASVLRGQVVRTALQFPTVTEVRFLPETLFQP
ncbi:MAG: GerMN domain-containing protein [Candidatus Paceibacterota bacterium]